MTIAGLVAQIRRAGWRLMFRMARWAHRRGWNEARWYQAFASPLRAGLFKRGSLGKPHRVVQLEDLVLAVPYSLTKDYFLREHEPETRAVLKNLLRPGDTFVDVGANIGLYTLIAASIVGPRGKVFAVEPGPDNLQFLRHNVATNGLGQVTVLPLAAGRDQRQREFHLSTVGTIHSLYSSESEGHTEPASKVTVRQMPLEEAVPVRPSLVKIDVEGAEIEALEGMNSWLTSEPKPILLVEWNPRSLCRSGTDPASLLQLLSRWEYRLSLLDADESHATEIEGIQTALDRKTLPETWYANILAEP